MLDQINFKHREKTREDVRIMSRDQSKLMAATCASSRGRNVAQSFRISKRGLHRNW